ncbi:hypothetical protein BS17DRAFT_813015 [Gyrodon lividus]|nr:hypothetical protein BS17DRAFT_813015 [Gyrodon lividus]
MSSTGQDMMYQLQHRKNGLASVYVQWECNVCHIPTAWETSASWGPTSSEVACAAYTQYHASVLRGGKDSEAEEKVNDKEDGGSDEGLGLEDNDDVTGAVEDMALVEEYGLWEWVEEDSGEDDDWEEYDSCMPSSPVKGPSSMKKMKLY